ncbi:hypothetical protein GRX03_00310 [Halovenus sp. WSH3]|uniref:Uncharacterized protein n=1 Tax=Halovenus carboxidivorans TaxID=2692199 RepID=A0A6B0T445_9EURY|nr:hypothetical protein [Halovenus carboxidivorans]MXR50052.1 hypothetical protein [Halovenus carboxidivorans]
MSGEPVGVGDSGAEELSENVVRLIGVASSVGNFLALTAVSYFLFESNWLVFGLTVGLLSGVGSFFLLPWLLQQQQEAESESDEVGEAVTAAHREEESSGARTAAFGAGLEAAAIGMLAGRLAFEDVLLGGGAGVAAGLAVFLLASVLFEYAN